MFCGGQNIVECSLQMLETNRLECFAPGKTFFSQVYCLLVRHECKASMLTNIKYTRLKSSKGLNILAYSLQMLRMNKLECLVLGKFSA
jgi:hypothetical protein